MIKINFKSKKASFVEEYGYILVLALLLMVILLLFIGKAGEQYEKKAYNDACNAWIKSAIMGMRTGLYMSPNEAPCQSQNIVIEHQNRFDLIKSVLDKKEMCYNSYYRGKVELFKGEGRVSKYCAVCYHINFIKKDEIFSGLDYLLALDMRSNSKEKYIDIFAPDDFAHSFSNDITFKNEFLRQNSILNQNAFNTSKEYIIVFTYHKAKPDFFDRLFGTVLLPNLESVYFMEDYIGFLNYHEKELYTEGVFLVEFNQENLNALECQTIVGIQNPGITQS
jgi:hypothetical protein